MKDAQVSDSAKKEKTFSLLNLSVLLPKNPLALLSIFKSLKHRNFALYFGGMLVTLIGAWIQQVAMGWLVYNMTNSVFLLSLSVFLSQIPTLFVTPFAGVVTDRFDRRKIIMYTQGAMMLQSLILGVLTISGLMSVNLIMILCFLLGVTLSFDAPARQSFYSKLVPPEDLSNAIALNSTAINATRFIGPAIGGVMIAHWGEGVCFLVNCATYLSILFSLRFIKTEPSPPQPRHSAFFDIAEGFSYAAHSVPIRAIIIILAVFSFFGIPFPMLMPAFAKGVLHGGSEVLGNLMSFVGIGAVTAALYLAARKRVLGLGRVVVVSSSLFGAGLIAVSFARVPWHAYVMCIPIGFGMIATAASCNTMLQSLVDENKRGRIMSIFTMSFFGIPPLGSIAQGYIANFISLQTMTAISGVICIISALVFEHYRPVIRTHARAIYAQKGLIIPEIASALQATNRKGG